MIKNWYPQSLRVGSKGTASTYEFLEANFDKEAPIQYAEFGIYEASTAKVILETFPNATVYLFDFEETIERAKTKLSQFDGRVFYFGNSQRHLDSYNWSLARLISRNPTNPIFDYVFLDGAHTYAVDALTFFLSDRLLRAGGFVDFDDYDWRLKGSSLDPAEVPIIAQQYTNEQVEAYQVKMIVDDLVKPDPRYEQIVANKIFRKLS